jgi:parallel beta-helix repeat protein
MDSWWRFPNGWYGSFAQYESVVNNWTVNMNSSIYAEFGTPEFNLWRLANTSGGDYFYADEPDKLDPIFQKLVEIIKSPTIEANSTIAGNVLINNKQGINLQRSKSMNISDNECLNNEYGIRLLSSSDDNLFTNNQIMNNNYGLYISNSKNNTIYHNNFINSSLHSFDNSINTWNASYPIGGNHWDTWTTPDSDADGFVDLPYNVTGGLNKDHLPFAKESYWANAPPTAPVIKTTPEQPYTSNDIVCTVITPSTDKDGDTIVYIYEWYLDNGSGFELQEPLTKVSENLSSNVDHNLTTKHDVWRCMVTPYDGIEFGPIDDDQVIVLNSIPTEPILEITPNGPYTNNDVTCKIISPSLDQDEDVVQYYYEWYKDSGSGFLLQETLSVITNNLSISIPANITIKHDLWRCVVTPFDGEINGSSSNQQVEILNSIPSQPGVFISPTGPKTMDDVVFTVSIPSVDLDLDIIEYTYHWYLDNGSGFALVPELTTKTTTLFANVASNQTTKHDVWRCIVTPNDSEINGSSAQDEVLILNSNPIALIDSPVNNSEFDVGDIVYFDASNSTDPDLDPLTYQWDFDYDGENFNVDAQGKTITKKQLSVFSGSIGLRVIDDDGSAMIMILNFTVNNVAPEVSFSVLPMPVNISIRITGEKWHDVRVVLYEDDTEAANGSLVRYPGNPNDQILKLNSVNLDLSKTHSAIVRYTPEDDPTNGQINGATPCWLILTYPNGSELRLKHTFNVKHPSTYVWEVNLTQEISFNNLTFHAKVFDTGPEELTLTWDFGD